MQNIIGYILSCFIVLLMFYCNPSQEKKANMNENEIVELPDNQSNKANEKLEYDYIVSEAAVGEIKGVHFTVAEITTESKDGKNVLTTYLDIEKQRFEFIYEGSKVKLNDQIQVLIVKLEPANTPQGKGKVYFKLEKE